MTKLSKIDQLENEIAELKYDFLKLIKELYGVKKELHTFLYGGLCESESDSSDDDFIIEKGMS